MMIIYMPIYFTLTMLILIEIFVNCNWVDTLWQ